MNATATVTYGEPSQKVRDDTDGYPSIKCYETNTPQNQQLRRKRLEMQLVVEHKEEKTYLFPRYTVAGFRAVKLKACIKLRVDTV